MSGMRANTQCEHQLAFDRVAEEYDDARPLFGDDLIQSLADVSGLVLGDRVLEIGAGTGQLTVGLIGSGLTVTAIEPGEAMRAVLARKLGGSGKLTVSGARFEDFTSGSRYRAVLAANSFHWLDPIASYPRAADFLDAGGHLCLLWNYPLVRPDLQARLNEGVFRQYPDFAGDEQSQLAALHESAADGRQELISSGLFGMPWWQWRTDQFDIDAGRYVRLLSSYANIACLDADERKQFAGSVGRELAAMHVSRVPITNHIYAVVARVKARGR
jgi:SAM-dependent methyltransferase